MHELAYERATRMRSRVPCSCMDHYRVLDDAHAAALRFLATLPERRVAAEADAAALRESLGGALPEHGCDARRVIAELTHALEPGLVASAGPRYFGFVVGGALPVAVAADWLTASWDQNAFAHALSPGAAVVEEVCSAWLLELLGLPSTAGVGFVTGGQMANFVGLCAARDELLRRRGVDIEQDGFGTQELHVLVGAQGHATIHTALRLLGIGRRQVVTVASDGQGRMRPAALEAALRELPEPAIVCTQAGNVNSGAFDPLHELIPAAHESAAWVHVDGAFGLWAAAHPELRAHVRGLERADSWAVDAHKWLNVPYDSGIAIVANARAQVDAVRTNAAPYLVRGNGERDGSDWVPESSRRARAFTLYATLRSLGRAGLAELFERCCALARSFADQLVAQAQASILNDVVLNQVLVRFGGAEASEAGDALTRAVIARVQAGGVCWAAGTLVDGRAAMRISVSNWSTSESDVQASVSAIASAVRAELAARHRASAS